MERWKSLEGFVMLDKDESHSHSDKYIFFYFDDVLLDFQVDSINRADRVEALLRPRESPGPDVGSGVDCGPSCGKGILFRE